MVRIKGRFKSEVTEDYQRLCSTARQLIPMSLEECSRLAGVSRTMLSRYLAGDAALDVHDLANLLRVLGLNTADLIIYAWIGQPPGLPFDLEQAWKKQGRLDPASENGDEVLAGLDACLRDHKVPRTSIPVMLGWEAVKPSGTMGRYFKGKTPFGWQRVLQVLHLAGIQPGEFARRYLEPTRSSQEAASA